MQNNSKKDKKIVEFIDPQTIAEKFDFFIKIIIGVFGVVILTLVFMVGTLIIDSFHFNSVTYKEYSQKVDEREEIIKASQLLSEENIRMQKTIQDQSTLIKELVNKQIIR